MTKFIFPLTLFFSFSCSKIEKVEVPHCCDFAENFIEKAKTSVNDFGRKYQFYLALKNAFAESDNLGKVDIELLWDLNMHKVYQKKSHEEEKLVFSKVDNQEMAKLHLNRYFEENVMPEIISNSCRIIKEFTLDDIDQSILITNSTLNTGAKIYLLEVDNVRPHKNFKSYYLIYTSTEIRGLGFLKFDYSNYEDFSDTKKYDPVKNPDGSSPPSLSKNNFAYMDLFAVSRNSRGQRVGYFLNKAFEKCVIESGKPIEYIHLYTYNRESVKNKKEAPAYYFYTKNGYKNAYHSVKPDSKVVDKKTVHMIKRIKSS